MANEKFHLSVKPLKLSAIPPEETILDVGRAVMENSTSWKPGKSFVQGTVKTYARPKAPMESAGWHCRVSEHTPQEATFDEFWKKLGENKAENEKNYVPDIKKVALIKELSPTQSIWTLYYTFPPPISPRVFTVLQTMHVVRDSPRTGLIISIPIDLSSPEYADLARREEKGVKGRYTSVERIMEMPNGNVEWRMATCSTPGGNIPQIIAEKTMASKISEDVPHFLRWLRAVPKPTKRRSILGQRTPTSPTTAHAPAPAPKAIPTPAPAASVSTPAQPTQKATSQPHATAPPAATPAHVSVPALAPAPGPTATHAEECAEHATNANAEAHAGAVGNDGTAGEAADMAMNK